MQAHQKRGLNTVQWREHKWHPSTACMRGRGGRQSQSNIISQFRQHSSKAIQWKWIKTKKKSKQPREMQCSNECGGGGRKGSAYTSESRDTEGMWWRTQDTLPKRSRWGRCCIRVQPERIITTIRGQTLKALACVATNAVLPLPFLSFTVQWITNIDTALFPNIAHWCIWKTAEVWPCSSRCSAQQWASATTGLHHRGSTISGSLAARLKKCLGFFCFVF